MTLDEILSANTRRRRQQAEAAVAGLAAGAELGEAIYDPEGAKRREIAKREQLAELREQLVELGVITDGDETEPDDEPEADE